ncbi:MAG: hypothetical protein M3N16_06020 [Actinomycetota bacterium]|nr:hypothetical protein [Actinomycetota bacterium]
MADEHAPEGEPAAQGGVVETVRAIGSVLVVGLGLSFAFVIAVVALATVPDGQKATVATSSFTVLGTIVGAYFGIRAGAAGRERAEVAREEEAVKVQELAARMDPGTAQTALDRAEERIRAPRPDRGRGRTVL